jgi:hypothetical protein
VGLESDPLIYTNATNQRIIFGADLPATLDFSQEREKILENIGGSDFNVQYCFDVLNKKNFLKGCWHYHIMHVSGHGIPANFTVEDDHCGTNIIT